MKDYFSLLIAKIRDDAVLVFQRTAENNKTTVPHLLEDIADKINDGEITFDNAVESENPAEPHIGHLLNQSGLRKPENTYFPPTFKDNGINGYVYKYVDQRDSLVKYVGLVKPGKSLRSRIKGHKRDKWYHDYFDIYYIKLNTQTDCEYCESLFISYYETGNFNNISKVNWGTSEFLNPEKLRWTKFS